MKKEKKLDESTLFKKKYFSKDKIINTKLANRSLGFFKRGYSHNLSISLAFTFIGFLSVLGGIYSVESKNKEYKVYLTNVNGQIEKYETTETRKKTIQDSYNYRKGIQNGKNNGKQ